MVSTAAWFSGSVLVRRGVDDADGTGGNVRGSADGFSPESRLSPVAGYSASASVWLMRKVNVPSSELREATSSPADRLDSGFNSCIPDGVQYNVGEVSAVELGGNVPSGAVAELVAGDGRAGGRGTGRVAAEDAGSAGVDFLGPHGAGGAVAQGDDFVLAQGQEFVDLQAENVAEAAGGGASRERCR